MPNGDVYPRAQDVGGSIPQKLSFYLRLSYSGLLRLTSNQNFVSSNLTSRSIILSN